MACFWRGPGRFAHDELGADRLWLRAGLSGVADLVEQMSRCVSDQ